MKRVSALAAALLAATSAPALGRQQQPAQPQPPPAIAPADNLVAEGVPAIPASLAEATRRYTEFRAAAFQNWHPTRREMLISTRFADTAQIHRVRMPLGDRTQVTFFTDRVQAASYEPRTGDYFVAQGDVGGNEFSQLFRVDQRTGGVELLTDGGRAQNGLGPWSTKGDRMAYSSTRRNGRDYDLYVMDPANKASDRLVAQVDGSYDLADWSPDDRTILATQGISANESHLWLFDVASGQKTPLTPPDEKDVAYGESEWAPDGKGIYVTTDRAGEFQQLAYMDLATKKLEYLSADLPWDVEEFDVSPDGKTIAMVTNEDGRGVLRVRDAKGGKDVKLPALPIGQIGGLQWREVGDEIAFSLSATRSAPDVYSIDMKSKTLTRWTESETGGLNPEGFKEPELVRWKSFDGKEISGFLYAPPAKFAGKRPVIINIHGGPESQFRPGFLGRTNYYMNELGVAVIFPNVRGSSGYGKSYLKLDNGFLREDSVKDIGALLDWIATQPGLDADRVMVTGGSYGGYMTLAVATTYDARIRASLDVVGISNFVTFLEKTEAYRRDLRRVEYGDERDPKMREFMQRIAPLNNATKITKPLFVVQGKNDPRVPLAEAEQMVATVREKGAPVWYLMAKDEGHGFAKKGNADFQFYATVMFVRQYLLS